MQARTIVLVLLVGVLLGAAPFAYAPGQAETAPVPFDDTKQTGLPDSIVQEARNSNLSIPRAEVYYSDYRFVVGYRGVSTMVASLRTQDDRSMGRPLSVHVTDYSDVDVSVDDEGHLTVPEQDRTGWIAAEDAYYVLNSTVSLPTRTTAIVPFSNRSDAVAFAQSYDGDVRRWAAVRRQAAGELSRSVGEWRERTTDRRARTDRVVERTTGLRERPVSVVVGEDEPTIQQAIRAAPPNTTVFVPSGTYRVDELVVDRPITIRGAGPNATRIVGDENGSVVVSRSPRTGVVDLGISGVGHNRSGADRDVEGVPIPESDWNYDYWKVHGYGDAAVVLDDADRSLVSSVRINTTSNGVIARNSANATVTDLTLYGTEFWTEGFLGVVALGEPVVVQDSAIYGGKVGVYSHDLSGTVVRNTTMEGMMVGVFDLFGTRQYVANNEIEDTWNAIYVEKRSTDAIVVGNDLHNSRNGFIVAGTGNFVADNVAWHNRNGFSVEGQFNAYAENTIAGNRRAVRVLTLFPTNLVTGNDFVANGRPASTSSFNVLHVWSGNFWASAPGTDVDDDGRLERSYRPTGAVDAHVGDDAGARTLALSPAVQVSRSVERVMPGLRSAALVDQSPRASPVHPDRLAPLDLDRSPGRHDDPDPWDYHPDAQP